MQFICVNGKRLRGQDARLGAVEQRLQTLQSQIASLTVENKGYKEDLAQLKKQFQTLFKIAGYQEKKLSHYKQNNERDPL